MHFVLLIKVYALQVFDEKFVSTWDESILKILDDKVFFDVIQSLFSYFLQCRFVNWFFACALKPNTCGYKCNKYFTITYDILENQVIKGKNNISQDLTIWFYVFWTKNDFEILCVVRQE